MSRYQEACPFDSRERANLCEPCCATNSVPPCVAAYLGARNALPASNVISIRRIEAPSIRKAA